LPAVGNGSLEIKPIEPTVPSDLTTKPKLPSTGNQDKPGSGDDPTFSGPTITNPPAEKPKEDAGVMMISVRSGGGASRTVGGSEPIGGNGLQALLRVGSQQYQMGNFAGAAKSYEQAVRAGGDAIILNRRLGQAYERLGRNSDAADAYRRCISAIDSAISSGRGNKDTLTSTREVCEQALKVLQGG
jgi:hypothetical protein